MRKVVLHHTCKKDGGSKFVLQNAPFLAKDDKSAKKFQFLGSGFYFWEDDINQAHYWGQVRYGEDNYFIVQFVCNIDEDDLLDLDSKTGYNILEKVKEKLLAFTNTPNKQNNWTLSQWVNFLYKYNEIYSIGFDFKAIKVKDYNFSRKKEQKIFFVQGKSNYTCVGGVYIYFFRKKEDICIEKKELI